MEGYDINSTQIGGQLGLNVKTAQKYIGLLEHIFLAKRLEPWGQSWRIYHYRDKDQVEVDFVLENSRLEVIGIEVKASSAVNLADFKGLIKLRDLLGKQFLCGVVVYDGEHVLPFGPSLWAVPLAYL